MNDQKADFMIVGAQKCATTTLFETLARHPDAVGAGNKEPHYFSTSPDWRRGLDDYHALFAERPGVRFEASTSYSFLPHRNLTIPDDLHEYNPALRFVYVVRRPIDRIVSAYMHARARGYTDKPIEAVVRSAPLYLDASRYHRQITPFLDRFGRDRVRLLDFDDLTGAARRATLEAVAAFVGLDPAKLPADEPVHANRSIGKAGQHHRFDRPPRWARLVRRVSPAAYSKLVRRLSPPPIDKPTLPPDMRRAILHMLEPDIRGVEELMERDLSHWRGPA